MAKATALAGLPLLVAVAVSPRGAALLLMLLVAALALALAHRWLLSWPVLIGTLVLVILFIPIRRYSLPATLPFELEPYRLLVIALVIAWVGALLIERGVKFRRTGLDGPVLALLCAFGLSIAVNSSRIAELELQTEVTKKLTFFVSFAIVLYVAASVVARRAGRDAVIRVMVVGSAALAVAAIMESRTGFNPFNFLHRAVPLLQIDYSAIPAGTDDRGGQLRAYASAQHSIALGAALVMIVPLAAYLALKTRERVWLLALALLTVGAMVTVSRTAMLMLVTEVIVLVCLKPAQVRRMWPLVLPLLVVVQFAMPGTIGALKRSFFPEGGLIAEQKGGAGTYGSGRIADLGPGIAEWSRTPVLGQGFGTRITDREDPKVNAPILDNQWLGLLLEVGVAGVAAMLWLLLRAVRRLGRAARRDDSDEGWRLAALAAAIAGYGVGMFTFDAFSFIQVTFLLFILLGLASADVRRAAGLFPPVIPKAAARRASARLVERVGTAA